MSCSRVYGKWLIYPFLFLDSHHGALFDFGASSRKNVCRSISASSLLSILIFLRPERAHYFWYHGLLHGCRPQTVYISSRPPVVWNLIAVFRDCWFSSRCLRTGSDWGLYSRICSTEFYFFCLLATSSFTNFFSRLPLQLWCFSQDMAWRFAEWRR